MGYITEVLRSGGSFPVSAAVAVASLTVVAYEIHYHNTMNKVAFAAGFLIGAATIRACEKEIEKDPKAKTSNLLGESYIGSRLNICGYNAFCLMENLTFGLLPFGISKLSDVAKVFFQNPFVLGFRCGAIVAAVSYQASFMKDHYFSGRSGSFGLSTD